MGRLKFNVNRAFPYKKISTLYSDDLLRRNKNLFNLLMKTHGNFL